MQRPLPLLLARRSPALVMGRGQLKTRKQTLGFLFDLGFYLRQPPGSELVTQSIGGQHPMHKVILAPLESSVGFRLPSSEAVARDFRLGYDFTGSCFMSEICFAQFNETLSVISESRLQPIRTYCKIHLPPAYECQDRTVAKHP